MNIVDERWVSDCVAIEIEWMIGLGISGIDFVKMKIQSIFAFNLKTTPPPPHTHTQKKKGAEAHVAKYFTLREVQNIPKVLLI